MGNARMRALQITEPGAATITEKPRPSADGVRLRVEFVGLCGTDLNIFRGRMPMCSFPRVIGHEIAATLADDTETAYGTLSAGTSVTVSPYTSCGKCASCRRGRVNACQHNQTLGVQRDGAMIEELVTTADKLFTGRLSLPALALVEPLSVGCHAVARGRVTPNDTVAVFGCGGVGLGAVAVASFRGARVIAIDTDEGKLDIAEKAGAYARINSSSASVHDRLRELTLGDGPDCIIEAVGLPQTFRAAVEEVAFTGRVVYIGYAKEEVAYETRLFVQKELDILGSRNATAADFEEVIRLLESGRFPLDQAITAIVPLAEAPAWLARWSKNPASVTKLLVKISE